MRALLDGVASCLAGAREALAARDRALRARSDENLRELTGLMAVPLSATSSGRPANWLAATLFPLQGQLHIVRMTMRACQWKNRCIVPALSEIVVDVETEHLNNWKQLCIFCRSPDWSGKVERRSSLEVLLARIVDRFLASRLSCRSCSWSCARPSRTRSSIARTRSSGRHNHHNATATTTTTTTTTAATATTTTTTTTTTTNDTLIILIMIIMMMMMMMMMRRR